MISKRLVRNRARCRDCGTVLESKHRHDFVTCPCGNFIDGGTDYRRAGVVAGRPLSVLEDLSEHE